MKLVSWGLIFVIVIFSFSFSLRVILDNKMEIMKKEIEYNNALNEATVDATKELANNMEYEYSTDYEDPRIILDSMEKFFETFALSFGYYGGTAKESQVRMYVPAILTMSYNGFYVYHMERMGNYFEHTLTPKQYYAVDQGDIKVNLTLDEYVRVNEPIELTGIDSENYTNAYNMEKRFTDYYEPNDVLVIDDTVDPPNISIKSNAYTYGGRIIGDINGDGSVLEDDLKDPTGLNTDLETLVWEFWDLEMFSDRSLDAPYTYTHTDFPEYVTYWYADLNQDGYIEDYDLEILRNYLAYKNNPTYKSVQEGRIVDIRHKDDIESERGLYVRTNADTVTYDGETFAAGEIIYEKSFYTIGEIRYLLEEWFDEDYVIDAATGEIGTKYLYRRLTPYTEEDYAFTLRISQILKEDGETDDEKYLYKGNPENTGFIDPLTGEYSIGEFHAKRKEIITQQVTEQLEYYVMKHNQYAGAYGITYDFVLPELTGTDWNNALNDITVLAFVQGIPILNQQYYNNYGMSGSNVVDKEFFIGLDEITGVKPKTYYTSRILSKTNKEFIKRCDVAIYDEGYEAAKDGYYPDTEKDNADLIQKINEDVQIDIRIQNIVGQDIILNISSNTYIQEILYMKDCTNKKDLYDSSNASRIRKVTNIQQASPSDDVIARLPKEGEGVYGILVRDIDGRTKFVTTGTAIKDPFLVATPTDSNVIVEIYNVIAESWAPASSPGGRLYYTHTSSAGTHSEGYDIDTWDYNYTFNKGSSLNKFYGYTSGEHIFKFVRRNDNKTAQQKIVIPYPNVTGSVTHNSSQYTLTYNGLYGESGIGGQVVYIHKYNGKTNTTTINISNISGSITKDIDKIEGTTGGTHEFYFYKVGNTTSQFYCSFGVYPDPIMTVSDPNETSQVTVNIQHLTYPTGVGGILTYEHIYGGSVVHSQTYNITTDTWNNTITLHHEYGKIYGIHRFTLNRNDGVGPIVIEKNIGYEPVKITVNRITGTDNVNIKIENLAYDGGIGGQLIYVHTNGTTSYTISNPASLTGGRINDDSIIINNMPLNVVSGSVCGKHTFNILRDDNTSATAEIIVQYANPYIKLLDFDGTKFTVEVGNLAYVDNTGVTHTGGTLTYTCNGKLITSQTQSTLNMLEVFYINKEEFGSHLFKIKRNGDGVVNSYPYTEQGPTIDIIGNSTNSYTTVKVGNLKTGFSGVADGGTLYYIVNGSIKSTVTITESMLDADGTYTQTFYRSSHPNAYNVFQIVRNDYLSAKKEVDERIDPYIEIKSNYTNGSLFNVEIKNLAWYDETKSPNAGTSGILSFTFAPVTAGSTATISSITGSGVTNNHDGTYTITSEGTRNINISITGDYAGTYTFTIVREDGKTASDSVTLTRPDLEIISHSYSPGSTTTTNTVTVTVSGLGSGETGTVYWKATGGDGNKLTTNEWNEASTKVTSSSNTCTIQIPASCIPGTFSFKVISDEGRTSNIYNAGTFYPKIRIGLWVDSWGNRKVKVESTTVMNSPTQIKYDKYKRNTVRNGWGIVQGYYYTWYTNGTASYTMNSNKLSTGTNINFDQDYDDPGYICLNISVNGFSLIYNTRYIAMGDDLYIWNYDKWLRPVDIETPNGAPTAAQLGSSSNLLDI